MLEFLVAAGAAGVGYVRSRGFVANRLRYVDAVRSPAAPLVAAVAATAVAAPIVWVVPFIGAGTALAFGVAVGIGTRAGVRLIRRTLSPGY
jgi:hypothetical protein